MDAMHGQTAGTRAQLLPDHGHQNLKAVCRRRGVLMRALACVFASPFVRMGMCVFMCACAHP